VHDRIARDGVIIGLLAYIMWGLLPVYFKSLASVDPTEMLAHRVVWAVPFGALIILLRRQWIEIRQVLTDKPMLGWLSLAALAISVNWLIYIWAVQNEQIFETSLGYYISPLMYVLAGVVLLGERLRRLQLFAVVLAFLGVMILAISGGEFPWVSISLALLFTLYGTIRKQIAVGAMPGLFIETMMLLPFALIWLLWLLANNQASFASGDPTVDDNRLHAVPGADTAFRHRHLLWRETQHGPPNLFRIHLGCGRLLQHRRCEGIKKAPAGKTCKGLIGGQ
jgi:chloramphenicol-sensitive protein RarD